MPFSFNPGQTQVAATGNQANGVPLLVVPEAPTITMAPVVEAVSPFAYKNRNKSKLSVYIQMVIFLIFGLTVIASFWLFSHQSTLKIQIAKRKSSLEEAQKGFTKPAIDDMQKLSSRLTLINKIMNERASVLTALKIIEESVNNPVTYNKFTLAKSKKDNYYDLSLMGETNSYEALYQQIEILKSKTFAGAFPKIAISGIGPIDKKGIANFRVDASIAIEGIDPDGFTVINKVATGSTTPDVASSSNATQIASSTGNVTP